MSVLLRSLSLLISLFFLSTVCAFAKSIGSTICNDPEYTCHTVKRGETWAKLFPNEAIRDVVMRINRMNIRLHPGIKIAIPKTESTNILAFSPFPATIKPPGEKVLYVSKQTLAFGAYDANGNLEHWGPISSAKGYCPDIGKNCRTPSGEYRIQSKQGAGCVSTKYPVGRGGAPMPYCMFYYGGFALHGSYEVPGYNASHGCVRLFVDDARWLNREFIQDEPVKVVVY